jgi:flagellar motor switch protein FliM
VNIGQLMALQPGDVISLDLPDVVHALVDGVAVLECRYGVMNGQYALKVDKVLAQGGGGGDGG